jgi:cell division protein FtsB
MLRTRTLTLGLLAALLAIQWPVWMGKGGWFKVWEREAELARHDVANEERKQRNAAIEADVRDLQTGTGAIEERARQELGLVKPGEIYVQIIEPRKAATKPADAAQAAPPASPQ